MARCVSVLCFALIIGSCSSPRIEADILFVHGQVYPGDTEEPRNWDVAVKGERVVFVGEGGAERVKAKETIDITGKVLCPGFIDPHTHALSDLLSDTHHLNPNYLTQGVTTVFVGNDGGGPLHPAQLRQRLEEKGVGTNVGIYAGHGTIRREVMGMADRAPEEFEMEKMKEWVKIAMEEGAFGLSTGLYYAPGSFADTEEVIGLASVAAKMGGIYESHIRDESSYSIGLLSAIRETLIIGSRTGIPVHISHIKALGVDVWGMSREVVALVDSAHKAGLAVTADQYPYIASGTSMVGALVPRWVLARGRNYVKTLNDPMLGPRAREAMRENMRKRGGAATLLISAAEDTALIGQNLAQLAQAWAMDTIDAAVEVIRRGGASIASFNMQEADLRYLMRQPWVMTCSDGSEGHPRKFGSFPKKIRQYVGEEKVLTLGEMIHRSSTLTARTLGITDRGLVQAGYWADLIIFDPAAIRDQATFEAPELLSVGMENVMVNGQWAIREGNLLPHARGKVLNKASVQDPAP